MSSRPSRRPLDLLALLELLPTDRPDRGRVAASLPERRVAASLPAAPRVPSVSAGGVGRSHRGRGTTPTRSARHGHWARSETFTGVTVGGMLLKRYVPLRYVYECISMINSLFQLDLPVNIYVYILESIGNHVLISH